MFLTYFHQLIISFKKNHSQFWRKRFIVYVICAIGPQQMIMKLVLIH